MRLPLSPLLWEALTVAGGAPDDLLDALQPDVAAAGQRIRRLDSFGVNSEQAFEVLFGDAPVVIDDCTLLGGDAPTYARRHELAREAREELRARMRTAVAALRSGLEAVVPAMALSWLSGERLQLAAWGDPEGEFAELGEAAE